MKIKVLGPGCINCQMVEVNVRNALDELGINAEVEHVYDFEEFDAYGLMASPGLVIEEELVSQGQIPSKEEIKQWIQEKSK